MKICYFGDYILGYPRHKVLQEGLLAAGAEVVVLHITKVGWRKYLELFKKALEIPNDTDVVLVAYSNSRFVWFLRLLTRKPIIWNAFYSLYDNWVFDRKRVKEGSIAALFLWTLDFICCHAANKIILETKADIIYFQKTFSVPGKKFIHTLLGYDEDIVKPGHLRNRGLEKFVVEFHGWYIPLQGASVIVQAAKLLEEYQDISFNLIGSGQEYAAVRKLAEGINVKNVTFLPVMPMEKIVEYIEDADVCIGLVGDVSRVDRAIANKVYEASGMQRACINADSEAIRELFSDRENILLIRRGDPQDLADKILELRNNPALKEKIALGAYEVVRSQASVQTIGRKLLEQIKATL